MLPHPCSVYHQLEHLTNGMSPGLTSPTNSCLAELVGVLALEEPRRSSPVLAPRQRRRADRGEQRPPERAFLFFSPSLNARRSLFFGSPTQR